MIGNFLKLFLARKYRIGTVLVVNRDNCCKERIEGTVVSVYDVSGKTEVKICGQITGILWHLHLFFNNPILVHAMQYGTKIG